MLKPVKILEILKNDNPKFIKTELVKAVRDKTEFYWELIKAHDSVHVIVYNETTDQILFVKQIRVPVLVNEPDTDGAVIEACAGLVDKDVSLEQIAIEEIEEELGYKITSDNINFIKSLKVSVGTSGATSHLFYATVNETQRVSDGGGLETEDIEVIRIDSDKALDYVFKNITDATTLFLTQYIINKIKG